MKPSLRTLIKARPLAGKTVAVSGATGGIGQPLCEQLIALGASLILLDRNTEKSCALARRLGEQYPHCSVRHIRVDLEDLETVRGAIDALRDTALDALILNAGAYSIPRHTCQTGYDNVFQINFIAPYLLASGLLPTIRSRGGKIVAVGSIAHRYSVTDPKDVDFSTRARASLVYGNAKRYLMASLPALGREISIVHPGITFTNITAHYPPLIFALIKYPMKVIFMPPRKASLCIIRGLFEDLGSTEWIGPRFFDVWGAPKRKRLRSIKDAEREAICRRTEKIMERIEQDAKDAGDAGDAVAF